MGLEEGPLGTFHPCHAAHPTANLCASNLSTKLFIEQQPQSFPSCMTTFSHHYDQILDKKQRGKKWGLGSQFESTVFHCRGVAGVGGQGTGAACSHLSGSGKQREGKASAQLVFPQSGTSTSFGLSSLEMPSKAHPKELSLTPSARGSQLPTAVPL